MNRESIAAAGEFLRTEYDGLCRYIYRVVGNRDDAIEVVQEACLRFCDSRRKPGEQNDRALLYRIARNLAIDLLRKRQVRSLHEADAERSNVVVLPVENPEEQLLEKERNRLVQEVFARLSDRHRECLVLRSSGLSYKDIGDTLGLSPESVGPTLARALRAFRTLYDDLVEVKGGLQENTAARRR